MIVLNGREFYLDGYIFKKLNLTRKNLDNILLNQLILLIN